MNTARTDDNATPDRLNTGAVVVLYHPDDAALARLATLPRLVARVYAVDNTPATPAQTGRAALASLPGVVYLPQSVNRGVGCALNVGITRARADGLQWLLMLDQDSQPPSNLVPNIAAALRHHPHGGSTALIGVGYHDAKPAHNPTPNGPQTAHEPPIQPAQTAHEPPIQPAQTAHEPPIQPAQTAHEPPIQPAQTAHEPPIQPASTAPAGLPRPHEGLPQPHAGLPRPNKSLTRPHEGLTEPSPSPLRDVTAVITSGSLLRLRAIDDAGPMREDFFIDEVDHEHCLRLRAHGWRVAVADHVLMPHSLGQMRRIRIFGRTVGVSNHNPTRRYYMARNRVLMARAHLFTEPRFVLGRLALTVWESILILFSEPDKRAKLAGTARGLWHGVLGRAGPISDTSR